MIIALTYHRLADDFARHLGRQDNNWYCFAVWSSKAIGESLDLAPDSPFLTDVGWRFRLSRRLMKPFRVLLLTLLGPSYQLGLALANRAIFLETGSLAANLMADTQDSSYKVTLPAEDKPGSPAPTRRPEFLSALLEPADDRYLDLTARLFTEAKKTTDPVARAELILGANVSMSAYEQKRAQRALELVLYRPVRWVMRVSWRSLWAMVRRRPLHRFPLYTTPHEEQPWLVRVLEEVWARLYTRYLMTLRTPVSNIWLGKPLIPPGGSGGQADWAPIQNPEVRDLVARFHPTDPDKAAAGVANWLSYEERMRFIVSYFRMYQAVPALFDPPFDPSVVGELSAELLLGEVPEPFTEWFQTKMEQSPGQPVLRQLFRSPVDSDPDAADLAQIDVRKYLEVRSLDLSAP
jgi:hypothetical protein